MQLREWPILVLAHWNTFRWIEPVGTCFSFASYWFKAYKQYMEDLTRVLMFNEFIKGDDDSVYFIFLSFGIMGFIVELWNYYRVSDDA